MVRIKSNVYSHKRKKRVLKEAKGQWGDRSKRYKEAIKSLTASRQYAFYDRKKKILISKSQAETHFQHFLEQLEILACHMDSL